MKTAVVLFSIVLGISAYNFDDALYNQFLAREFESLGEEGGITAVNPRIRRQAEADKCPKPSSLCCGRDELERLQSESQNIRKQCFKEVTGHESFHGKPFDPFSCEDIEKRKKEMICVKQCVAQKKDLADQNGNLKESDMKKHVIELNKMDWLAPKLDGFITKCLAEAKQAAESTDKSDKDACNPAMLKFSHCMFREVQLSCPADQIEDPKRCAIIRQFAQHSNFFLPYLQHH